MKKTKFVFAALLLCSIAMLTSCSKDEDPSPVTPSVSDAVIKSKIEGVWVLSKSAGQVVSSENKYAMKFENGMAYESAHSLDVYDVDSIWRDWDQCMLEIKDGKVKITEIVDEEEGDTPHTRIMRITAISDTEMDCVTYYESEGQSEPGTGETEHWVKSNIEPNSDICGLWQVKFTSGTSEQMAQKSFYVQLWYSGKAEVVNKNADGEFVASEDYKYLQYVNAGPLVFFRWEMKGKNIPESTAFEIESINDGVMKIRFDTYKDDSETELTTATAELTKVIFPTVDDATIKKFIPGQWLLRGVDSENVLTSARRVINFTSASECYISLLDMEVTDMEKGKMKTSYKADVQISGGRVTLSFQDTDGKKQTTVLRVTAIDDLVMMAESGELQEGETEPSYYILNYWIRITGDYSKDICGLWEGTMPQSKGDGKTHRWEFMADGTYKYYTQDASGNWVNEEGYYAEYFTAGPQLVMRWAYKPHSEEDEQYAEEDGYIHRFDTWSVTIEDGTMTWEDDDVTTTLKKVVID